MALPSKNSFWRNRGVPRVSIRDVTNAQKWFQSKADHEMSALVKDPFIGPRRKSKKPNIGSMYLYGYHAKWDKQLPTWDKFPLIFCINLYTDGWLGLNFHYLPIPQRYQLGAALMKAYVQGKGRQRDYLKLSWPILKGISKSKHYEPCIKRYLYSQLRTPFHYIDADEWPMAVVVPVQKFVRGNPY